MVRSLTRLLLLAVALPACGSDNAFIPIGVGPQGGTFYLDQDSLVSVTFPPGALSTNHTLSGVPASGPASPRTVPGTVFDVTLDPDSVLALDAVVKIKIRGLPANFVASELRIYKVVNGAWERVTSSTFNASDTSITATVRSFSVYGLQAVPVATVNIDNNDTTLTLGDAVQLTAATADSNGTDLPNRSVTWTSLQPTVVSVNSNGTASAQSVSSALIVAEADGAADTIQITVQGATSQVWLEENFLYASTTELMADPRDIYSQNEDADPSRIFLDTEGFDAATNSMRYDYPDRTGIGGSGTSGRCTDYTLGRNMTLPSPVQEVWAEFYVKFSSNFVTRAPAAWGCTSNPDLKFIFGRLNGVSDRFIVKIGAGGSEWHAGYPGGPQAEDTYTLDPVQFPMSAYWDNQWFRIRLHFKLGTTASSADGAMHMWLDNQLVVNGNNLVVHRNGVKPDNIYSLALGRNMNQGPGQVQSVWFGRIRVYNTNPGW